MKLREGDQLQCQCGDCFVQLRVIQVCSEGTCDDECEAEFRCCGDEMKVYPVGPGN